MLLQDLTQLTFIESESGSVVPRIKDYLKNALDGELNIIDSIFPESDVRNIVPHFELYALAQASGHDLPVKYTKEICRGFMMAAQTGQVNALRGMLSKHGADFFADHLDWALYMAVENDHPEIVKAICEAKKSFAKSTALVMAVYDAEPDVSAILSKYINLDDFEPPRQLYADRDSQDFLGPKKRFSLTSRCSPDA